MAGLNKKRPVFATGHVERYLDAFSKAALIDLVVDLVRASHGEEVADYELLARISEAAGPVITARGDKIQPAPYFFRARAVNADRLAALREAHNTDLRAAASLREGAVAFRAVADAIESTIKGTK